MGTIQAQMWKGSNFTIERMASAAPQTAVFRFSGPFTARDMYQKLTPAEIRSLFEALPNEQHTVQVFDLAGVPYMDSTGLGMIVSQFVRCQGKSVRLVLTGVGPRVLQLLQLTKTDSLIPIAAMVDEVN